MEELVFEFLINGIALALLLSVVLCGAIRFAAGTDAGPGLAGLAIGLAFLAAYVNVLDWPPWPPRSASQKVGYLVLISLVAGGLLDWFDNRLPEFINRPGPILLPAIIFGWIGWRQITSFDVEGLMALAALWLAGRFVFVRLQAASESGNACVAAVPVLAASVGISVIAFIGAAASQAQLAGLLAAAVGGFLVWNWPTPRFAFNHAAVFASATALMAISATIVLFTYADRLAMALILAVFLVPAVLADRLRARTPALQSMAVGGLTLIPVALAVVLALIS
jgi:hypothetical protein